jgi:adenylosuccinate synthase
LHNVRNIAGTGQGVGPALEHKLWRTPRAIYSNAPVRVIPPYVYNNKVCFLEIPQGFSLGINSGFYPHVTSRECSVAQALADAGMPPSFHRKTIMAVRTYPIRVGDTENSSGPCYEDQEEISWESLGQKPEMTTVTGRIRRVFTWSIRQFRDALAANDPSVIFLNFVNYLQPNAVDEFVISNVLRPYRSQLGHDPECILLGFSPRSEDIKLWRI